MTTPVTGLQQRGCYSKVGHPADSVGSSTPFLNSSSSALASFKSSVSKPQ